MIKECILLAGGFGTRLRESVPDLPKALAPVAGKPFLSYVIDYFRMQGVQRFIFSLGYRHEDIQNFLEEAYSTLDYTVVIEESPLGTGGAIALALKEATTPDVLVANGDTIFKVDVEYLASIHLSKGAACTLALKPMERFDRYGAVQIDEQSRILRFMEKQPFDKGLINGGVYLIRREAFLKKVPGPVFSFEKDYLERFVGSELFYGAVQEGYFIDIGIPQDFEKANSDLRPTVLDLDLVDRSWTLFLDRDGVINNERVGHYVLQWDEFNFSQGVLQIMPKLAARFGRIFIVSNQRGVGKGLMSEADLQGIHDQMVQKIEESGGMVNDIFYCTEKDDKHFERKPNPGMAFRAQQRYKDVDLSKSIMVGNKPSDMRFGRAAGMFTVFVKTTNPDQPLPHPDVDLAYPSLYHFAAALKD